MTSLRAVWMSTATYARLDKRNTILRAEEPGDIPRDIAINSTPIHTSEEMEDGLLVLDFGNTMKTCRVVGDAP